MKYTLLLSLFVSTIFSTNLFSQCNHQDDYTALRALYLSTSGDNWKDNTGWPSENDFLNNLEPLPDTDLSTWKGIQCEDGRVHRLSLFDNNLRDTLPSELSLLSNLEFFVLVRNKLRGEVLHLFSDLEHIEDIRIGYNDFTGEIPQELADKAKLNFLGLEFNEFTGPIPGSLGRLLNLFLNSNNFSGCLDPEFFEFCTKPNVDMANNPQLPWEGNVEEYCSTNGEIAEQIGAPCRVFPKTYPQAIDENCNCSPECDHPDFLTLRTIYSKTGGSSWTKRDGWNNDFTSECNPCNWYGVTCNDMGRVSELNLYNNNLRSAIPKEIKDLTHLKKLNLSYNDLIGNIPEEIGELTLLTDLNLYGNTINGVLPESLGNLTELDSLSIGSNELTGSIPESISNLIKLKYLILARNQMTGKLPQDFTNLVNLEELKLSLNKFSGVLPEDIGAMSKLKMLHVDNNKFEGVIPSQLGDLDSMFIFKGQRNNFSGCYDQSFLKFCGAFQFRTESNPLLPWLGDFGQFCQTSGSAEDQEGAACGYGASGVFDDCECILSVDPGYSVEGVLCKEWLQDTLSNLPCYDNGFGDKGFHSVAISQYMGSPVVIVNEGFAFASKVGSGYYIYTCEGEFLESCFQSLGVGCEVTDTIYGMLEADPITIYNCFSDTFPDCSNFMQHMDYPALRALYQSTDGNNWTNNSGWEDGQTDIFIDPCNWFGVSCDVTNRVDSINLKLNGLNGLLPNEIGNLDSLKYLNLAWNPIYGSFPDAISKLKVLNYIDLSLCDFDIPINEAIGGLTNLEYLNLELNDIIGALPESLGNLKKLKYLNFDHNKIESLHSTIGNMESLEFFSGVFNEIEDSLSNDIGNLSQLKNIEFSGNKIGGVIPNSITKLSKLEKIELTHNRLHGEIPADIGMLSALKFLYLGGNNLDGTIPESILGLKDLQQFHLWDNNFSGEIPNAITNLDSLKAFNLRGNNFTGPLPDIFSNINIIESFSLNRNNLSGCIPDIYSAFCADVTFDLSENPMLPWEGDVDEFCLSDGLQIGAPCDDGNDANGIEDVILEDCKCGPKPVGTVDVFSNIKIYPIPTSGKLYIEGLEGSNWHYEIVDILGISVRKNVLQHDQSISMNDLLAGIYILKIFSNDVEEFQSFKIVKE